MTDDLLKRYCSIVLKKIVAEIATNKRKKERATETAMATSETAADVRSSRHWKAVSGVEFHYAEIERGFYEMAQLDEATHWSEKLHQDRFEFLHSKYADILAEYLDKKGAE